MKKSQPKAEPKRRSGKDVSESSDKYTDEDFESYSKSASHSLPNVPGKRVAQSDKAPHFGGTEIASRYVQKVNAYTMTDGGKYDYQTAEQHRGSGKEWTLQRELQDAELLIQQHQNSSADNREELQSVFEKMKRMEVDYKNARREALNADATNTRLKEQLKDYMHKINLYKIETEDLIKQIDMADAKTREKEDELRL